MGLKEASTHEYPPEMDAWLKEAKLGPYEGSQDWAEIEAKARKEGEVIVYSSSSRIAKVAEAFEVTYPGIKVTCFDLGSVQTVEKAIQEQESGLYNADIITTGGSGQVIYGQLENNRIVNFVPDTVGDQIPKELKEPLLARINMYQAALTGPWISDRGMCELARDDRSPLHPLDGRRGAPVLQYYLWAYYLSKKGGI